MEKNKGFAKTIDSFLLLAIVLIASLLCLVALPQEASAETQTVSVYRLYNPYSGEHFYTTDTSERDGLVQKGWNYEGLAWKGPTASESPVYRLYSRTQGDHHYTTNPEERDNLVNNYQWNDEGVAFYADDASSVNVYRAYNPNAWQGQHHFTTSKSEYDYLVSVGWTGEGIAYKVSSVGKSTPIMSTLNVGVARMVAFYKNACGDSFPSDVYTQYGAATIDDFCKILIEESTTEGVSPNVIFVQSMLETGYLKFGGQVKAEQCNFAGIGATDDGAHGADFSSYGEDGVRMGLRAQVQHMKAYASTESLVNPCVDPRFNLVKRGKASYVEDLGNGNWATDPNYATKLLKMIAAL